MIIHDDNKQPFFKVTKLTDALARYVRYSVPVTYRFFENSSWYVHRRFIQSLIRLAADSGVAISFSNISETLQAELADGVASGQTGKAEVSSSYAKLFLLPNAPIEVVKAVYKKLVIIHHPDTGDGNVERFNEITEAYQKIVG